MEKFTNQQLRHALTKITEELKKREGALGFRSTPGGSYNPPPKEPAYVVLPSTLNPGLCFYKYKDEDSVPVWAKNFQRIRVRNRIEFHSRGAEEFWRSVFNNPDAKWTSTEVDKTGEIERQLNNKIEADLIIQKANDLCKK